MFGLFKKKPVAAPVVIIQTKAGEVNLKPAQDFFVRSAKIRLEHIDIYLAQHADDNSANGVLTRAGLEKEKTYLLGLVALETAT